MAVAFSLSDSCLFFLILLAYVYPMLDAHTLYKDLKPIRFNVGMKDSYKVRGIYWI
jgi:hypothetical protein